MADLWTIEDVAAFLGIKPSSARGTLSRMGVRAHSYRPHPTSHRAQALYEPEEVQAAHTGRPGKGARTDLSTDVREVRTPTMATKPTEAEIEALVRAAGWEPTEPYPGTPGFKWALRCLDCGREVRQKSTSISRCTHPTAPSWYFEWRERFESGDTEEDAKRLKLAGWEPAGAFPARVDEPLRVRCVRCGAERDLNLKELALANQAPQPCRHPGGEARHLTLEERRERLDVRKEFRDEEYEAEARDAGWEPVEPRPARETTPWKLRCTTCGEVVLAKVSKGEHEQSCPHGLTPAEQAAHDKFVEAGWEPLEHPMRGSLKNQWLIRCTTCGHETRRAAAKRIRPCTHPDQATEE